MPIPSYQELMLPVLKLIRDGHETIPQCIPPLAAQFGLSQDEVEEMLPSGKQTKLSNRAHWARNYMSQAGLVTQIKRGHYELSNEGRKLLAQNPDKIDKKFLTNYQPFQDFLDRGSLAPSDKSPSNEIELATDNETPEDALARNADILGRALRQELLTAVLAVSPSRFEQLIVDLLIAMGYGGGDPAMGQSIGKSGDGGIDGIINEDALGLDAVYVQAKRYAPENKVGRPALQAFVGSLTGEGANKGVFVTTSDFSREAQDYLTKVQHRIVLINGDRLAQLMILHGVGVRVRKTYLLQSVDEDYFAEI